MPLTAMSGQFWLLWSVLFQINDQQKIVLSILNVFLFRKFVLMNMVSSAAIAMIERFEVGGEQDYVARPTWPGGASGVTIGVGYDLGYASPAQIAEDWAMLPKEICHRLQSYSGKTGVAAAAVICNAHDIFVPEVAALDVFRRRDIPRAVNLTNETFLNCAAISPDSFGALVSLVFNRGSSMRDTQPNSNRLEMRQIRDAMARSEFDSIPTFIRNMKRLWIGKGLDGLLARRDTEAAMFENGLSQPKPTPP